ncbi:hypothetical protein [Vibrio sp. EA2]|uniref:hypothetical protein n=1 Tax=Vibrio sp. EA2 TaxID=3079860 RepID=UPI002949C717|nr:hypothetical protein [Vibrio sp. EA2]MDV6251055.1 hypothetical protein [Vibrio sp. EA2]
MPAQKLTKARLAQILITLSVLVGAFLWRTFTHETPKSVDCSQKERCDVTISGERITINRDSDGFSIETLKSSSLTIDLDQSEQFINVKDINKKIEWISISQSKIIKLKIDQNIVVVQL